MCDLDFQLKKFIHIYSNYSVRYRKKPRTIVVIIPKCEFYQLSPGSFGTLTSICSRSSMKRSNRRLAAEKSTNSIHIVGASLQAGSFESHKWTFSAAWKTDDLCFEHRQRINSFWKCKNVTLYCFLPFRIEHVSFSRLESMEFSYDPSMFNAWRTFFKDNRNIRRLNLMATFTRESVPLVELTTELHNLEEMRISCYSYIDANVITEFLRTHQNLMKFTFVINEYKEEDKAILRQRFNDDGWTIESFEEKYDKTGLSFERN